MGFKFMYSEGSFLGKLGTKQWPVLMECSVGDYVHHYPSTELLLWLEVTQTGLLGWHKGSRHVFWLLLLLPPATITKTVTRASTWPFSLPWEAVTETCAPMYVCIHTLLCMWADQGSPWGSWPVIWQSLTIAVSRCLGSRAKQMDEPSGIG